MKTTTAKSRCTSPWARWLILTSVLVGAGTLGSARADVVARVGATEVTGDELKGYLDSLAPQDRATLAGDPALLSQLVRSYLARHVVLKEAQAKKWDQRPEVKVQLERARDQALLESYLQSVSIPAEGYPSEAELQAAYDANKKAFEVPRQFRVAQIFIAIAKNAEKDVEEKGRKRLEEILKKLKAKGADFAAVARAESDESAATDRGGEAGWLTEAQMLPPIRSAVTALAPAALSEPIRLNDGWHLVKLLETKPSFTRPLSEVRAALQAQVRAERTKANRQAYLAKLLEQNPPALNELALSRLVKK